MPSAWGKKLSSSSNRTKRSSLIYNGLSTRTGSVLNSDGNSNSLENSSSSDEYEESRRRKTSRIKHPPSFDEVVSNGRSYVDPWDMENYSFLRRLEEVSIRDDVSSTPAFESTQSDFYYVPLDNEGSPQFQYHLDSNYFKKSGMKSPILFQDESISHVAGVEEKDFNNEYLDNYPSYLRPGSEQNNPSRQSERSRFNSQDYQMYTPAAISVDIPDYYYQPQRNSRPRKSHSELNLTTASGDEWRKLDTRARKGYRTSFCGVNDVRSADRRDNTIQRRRSELNKPCTSMYDRLHLGRSKSFHEIAPDYDLDNTYHTEPKERRRKSFLDATSTAKPLKKKRFSMQEHDMKRVNGARSGLKKSLFGRSTASDTEGGYKEILRDPYTEILSTDYSDNNRKSSLVYVYETANRRRKMVLPNPSPVPMYAPYRQPSPEYDETFTDRQYKPFLSKYAMTNYGHLKIDYSCSWNSLDRYIAHRMRV